MGLDQRASAKLAVIWIINTRVALGINPNLGFDLTYFSFLFYIRFALFSFLHQKFLKFFPRE